MTTIDFCEGDKCPEKDCGGTLCYAPVNNCSCHINPPCSQCVENPLVCDKCKNEPPKPKEAQ